MKQKTAAPPSPSVSLSTCNWNIASLASFTGIESRGDYLHSLEHFLLWCFGFGLLFLARMRFAIIAKSGDGLTQSRITL
jgi:hypothetical protein